MSLFAEIARAKAAPAPSARDAVAADLERICATRRLSLLLAPEYGVDDATSLFHTYPQINAWAAHLERTIAFYEPRLRAVQVVPIVGEPSDLTLHAEIRGVLVVDGSPSDARFTATLDPQCRMSVR
jgi:type VI secretion system protein